MHSLTYYLALSFLLLPCSALAGLLLHTIRRRMKPGNWRVAKSERLNLPN